MSGALSHYYWDSCVFIAFLNDEQATHGSSMIDQIGQHLDEAKAGKCKIYCSSITVAEINNGHLKKSAFGTFPEFLATLKSSVVQVSPDPNIMAVAGQLRSLPYTKGNGQRSLGTPDAIHLATALALIETFKVPLDAFHTFDSGKSKGPDGRNVGLLNYHEWCQGLEADALAQRVVSMKRSKPEHPTPMLLVRQPASA
ncbi:type II toxin-antitoxin system VapC family toxin [Labrys neptuniae]